MTTLFVSTPSCRRFGQPHFSSFSHTVTRPRPTTLWTAPSRRQGSVLMCTKSDTGDSPASGSGVTPSASDDTVSQESVSVGEEGQNVIFDDEVKEPYSGFFADMKRMGMSDEEARAQAIKQMKQSNPTKSDKVGGAKSLFREDGTPYAPWMANYPTDYNNTVIKQRSDATGRLAADPQLGELSGVGMTWKVIGDNDALELAWATGAEEGNVGFVVYRRRGKSNDWEKIEDFRTNPNELRSKGPQGGSYTYNVPDPEPGTWVYRISDVDSDNQVADLSQVLVEIESPEDSKIQKIALIGLLLVLAIALGVGVFLDPQTAPPG